MENVNILASLSSWADQVEPYLVTNPEAHLNEQNQQNEVGAQIRLGIYHTLAHIMMQEAFNVRVMSP